MIPKMLDLQLIFSGRNVLHLACVNGQFKIIQTLLQLGCNPNLTDQQGYAPIHLVVGLHGENIELANLLLVNNADYDQPAGPSGARFTPLRLAIATRNTVMADFLVEKGL